VYIINLLHFTQGCVYNIGEGNMNILQHLQSDRRSGASSRLFCPTT